MYVSPNLLKVYSNDMIVAVEAAKQAVTVGKDTVSRLIFADDFVGISETLEGLQEQIEKGLECTRKWRVTANAKECAAVVACNEDKVNPVTFQMDLGRRLITDRRPVQVPWRRDLKRMPLGCTQSKSDRKG